MSLDTWLARGKKVNVGGRDLLLMPLPLSRLAKVGDWLEMNSKEVVSDVISKIRAGEKAPNLATMMITLLLKIDVPKVALELFSIPKDLDGNLINKNLTIEFLNDYMDIPTSHDLFKKFVELNELEELIKNLQSLPIIKTLMEVVSSHIFGTSSLSTLPPNMDLSQNKSEGSPTLKSTDSSMQPITSTQGTGAYSQMESQKKEYVQ